MAGSWEGSTIAQGLVRNPVNAACPPQPRAQRSPVKPAPSLPPTQRGEHSGQPRPPEGEQARQAGRSLGWGARFQPSLLWNPQWGGRWRHLHSRVCPQSWASALGRQGGEPGGTSRSPQAPRPRCRPSWDVWGGKGPWAHRQKNPG